MTLYAPPCSLLRRLGAIIYDAILLAAVLVLATFPVVLLHDGATEGEPWFTAYVIAIGYIYFAGFWTRSGQTLGMRTWRIVIIHEAGGRPGWRDSLIRYAAAIGSWLPLGAGFLWSLIDGERRTFHDLVSRTSLVVLPRTAASGDATEPEHAEGGKQDDRGGSRE